MFPDTGHYNSTKRGNVDDCRTYFHYTKLHTRFDLSYFKLCKVTVKFFAKQSFFTQLQKFDKFMFLAL